jgi:diguanylate cyclase (GGDEF)-like protein
MGGPDPGAATPPMVRDLSVGRLWRYGTRRERTVVAAAWLLSLAASIGLGLASVIWDWSGIPLSFGGSDVYVTLYPPLLICLPWALTCGFWWGAIPAYLSTLTLALYAGMPLSWAVPFAFSDPLGLLIMTLGYQAINVRRDLRDLSAVLFFVQLAFVASVYSSSGALIWSYTNRIDPTGQLAIWQGWWLGAFLQEVVIVGPLLALFWSRIERCYAGHPHVLGTAAVASRRSVLCLLSAAGVGVLAYGYLTLSLAGYQLDRVTAANGVEALRAVTVMRQTTWVFFWVFALIVLFMAFFGYQIFSSWQASTDVLLAKLHEANATLQKLALTDPLTGLHNRRAVEDRVRAEWIRTRRGGNIASAVMLDIDLFKQINDRHGHAVGDAVIRALAQSIRSCIRDIDAAGRYGGEEFLIILPQADAKGAWLFAERLRKTVVAQAVPCEKGEVPFRISLGVAQCDPTDSRFEAWLERADQALYQAKRSGRNMTVVSSP